MALPEEDQTTLEQLVEHLEGLFRENVMVPELRRRFFVQRQQKDKSHIKFAVALQHLWKRLEKKDACSCAEIVDSGHILRG